MNGKEAVASPHLQPHLQATYHGQARLNRDAGPSVALIFGVPNQDPEANHSLAIVGVVGCGHELSNCMHGLGCGPDVRTVKQDADRGHTCCSLPPMK